ncbi:hypothetical protein TA3x_005595 [Tundrisphaera sp. TA3]|uniref:hypothetical protein n=1 Tax=Tundrisphaera sp. TA3 TaxID=3435775 RepID=UPI003EB7F037
MPETPAISEPEGLDEFMTAYIEAALWSSMDNADDSGGEPLDRRYDQSDIAPDTLAQMRADCIAFMNHKLGGRLIAIAERLEAEGRWSLPGGARCSVTDYAGHDFLLTRSGHGAGFWDGDWPRGIGEGLDRLAREFGVYNPYIGDDGLVYGC